MTIPLYAFVRGDTLGLLILTRGSDTVAELARDVQGAATVRVRPRPRVHVYHDGRLLRPDLTVEQAGLTALDRIDVIPEEEEWPSNA